MKGVETMISGKSAMVTGYGFVGRHLVEELLKQGAKVTILDKNLEHLHLMKDQEVKVIRADLRHLQQNLEFDYVFHTAAITHVGYGEQNYIETYESNVIATLNLLKHIKVRERFVFTSTAVVYSNVAGKRKENEITKPISLYGLSKIAAEELIKHFAEKDKFNYTIFRFFNIYGEGQSDFFLVPQIINEALTKHKITLWNTTSNRDFIYIKDIARGVVKLAQQDNARNEIINLGSGIETSSGKVAETISNLLGGGLEIEDKHIYDPASLATLIADTTKAEGLGFKATTPIEEGLKATINEAKKRVGNGE